MSRLDLEIANVKRQVVELYSLDNEIREDEQLRLDMLEGSTDLNEIVSIMAEIYFEKVTYSNSEKSMASKRLERASLFDGQAETIRSKILNVLQFSEVQSLRLPIATLSIRKGSKKVKVDDVEILPQGYFKIERKADLAAIKQGIEAGEEIPGARLENGQNSLTIRTK